MTDVNKMHVEVDCPTCKKAMVVTLGNVINEETVKCASCGKDFGLKDFNESREKSAKRNLNAFAKLEKKFKTDRTEETE